MFNCVNCYVCFIKTDFALFQISFSSSKLKIGLNETKQLELNKLDKIIDNDHFNLFCLMFFFLNCVQLNSTSPVYAPSEVLFITNFNVIYSKIENSVHIVGHTKIAAHKFIKL